VTVSYLNRTLDQELTAIVRGASLECLVCGEFLLHANGRMSATCVIACPECGSSLVDGFAATEEAEREQRSSG
jgi:4-hydroxy-3-methylbut-2-en-1-yl diphosphate synthase IspG/GcpE